MEPLAWAAYCAFSGPSADADRIWPYDGSKRRWLAAVRAVLDSLARGRASKENPKP